MVGKHIPARGYTLSILCHCFQDMALKMSDTATTALADTLGDPEEPFTPELEETATGVAGCLRNVMKGASQGAGSSSSSKVGLN